MGVHVCVWVARIFPELLSRSVFPLLVRHLATNSAKLSVWSTGWWRGLVGVWRGVCRVGSSETTPFFLVWADH